MKRIILCLISLTILSGCYSNINNKPIDDNHKYVNKNNLIEEIPYVDLDKESPSNNNKNDETDNQDSNSENDKTNDPEYRDSNSENVLILVNKENSIASDFVPQNLIQPNVSFTFKEDLPKKHLIKVAAEALEKMFNEALKDNVKLYALSGYRSYDTQKATYSYYVETIGKDATNILCALPGKSEHQTGLAMDITAESVGFGLSQNFGETEEGKWLKDNASNHGFIIRYPNGKEDITGYQYEPWHVRYVGKEVAKYISENNTTLEEYFNKDIY